MEITPKRALLAFSFAALGISGFSTALYVHNKTPEPVPVTATVQKPVQKTGALPTVRISVPVAVQQPAVVELTSLEKMQDAVDADDLDTLKSLIAQKSVDMKEEGGNLAFRAVNAGSGIMLATLLDAGADKNAVDEDGYSLLMRAAELKDSNDSLTLAIILTGAKADINTKLETGQNALMIATMERNQATAKIILGSGGKSDEVFYNEDGFTPLMVAAQNGDAALLQDMLAKKPDVNIKNNDGETALMLAVRAGNGMTSMLLIRAGASLDVRNEAGETAIDIAKESDVAEISSLLQMISEKSPILNLQAQPSAKQTPPAIKKLQAAGPKRSS